MGKKEDELMKRCIVYDAYANNQLPRYYVVDRIRHEFEKGGWYSVIYLKNTGEMRKYGTLEGAKKYALRLYDKYHKELGDDMDVRIREEYVDNKKLERKLSELNTRIVEEMELSAERRRINEDLSIKNRKLKQQLAEKEETIKEINKEFVQAVKDWKLLVEQKNKDIAELEEHDRVYHNQLAIAELEKVQSGLYSIPAPYDMITSLPISGNTFSNGFHKGMYKVIELIDNQIKQLKEVNK